MLDNRGLRKLFHIFCKLDNTRKEEIFFPDFLRLIREVNYSIVAPYAEWLFDTIKKENYDRLTF